MFFQMPQQSNEYSFLMMRIEELRAQVAGLTTLLQNQNLIQATGSIQPLQFQSRGFHHSEAAPIRLRESDSTVFLELNLPQLALGDLDVEVHGTRVTCRTRIAIPQLGRWAQSNYLPRGFEVFELPDGRVEFCWLATVPFNAKDIEATFRDGYVSISIPKSEVIAKHTVKVVREAAGTRRAANDMNS